MLAIASAILAGHRLGMLAIRGAIRVQRGAPGEVDMLAGVLRVVTGIGVGAAMLALFGQLEKVGTARQDAAFILDEVVIRITYDTDWEEAEQILLAAAREVTREVIAQTGQEPYVRADMYDYGVYMRLRFMTRATDRQRTTYEIVKRVFQDFQCSARVDFAIPYIYSFRKGVQASARHEEADVQRPTMDVPLGQIVVNERDRSSSIGTEQEIGELAARIQAEGLIQPVVLDRSADGQYQVAAGHMRVEACKRLGWRSLPAIVRGEGARLSMAGSSEEDHVSQNDEGADYARQRYSTDQTRPVGPFCTTDQEQQAKQS
jgi:hypothetical protein